MPFVCTILLIMAFIYINTDERPGPESVERTISGLEKMLGISITIHDPYGKLMLRTDMPFLSKRQKSHRKNYLCGTGFCQKCENHCGVETNKRAAESDKAFVHECWKGLSEIVIPIHQEGVHIATFFAGTWRAERLNDMKFKGRTSAWDKQRSKLKLLSRSQAEEIISLLSAFARGLFSDIHKTAKKGMHAPTRKQEITRFLRLSNPGAESIHNLADILHVSASRASHIVSSLFDVSFQELVKRERIDRAKSLLVSTDLPVKEIAQRTGIDNQYYFSRLFRRETGCSPSEYRKSATH